MTAPSSGESTNHRFLPHMTPSAACIAPGVRGACGSRSFAHVTQFTKGAAASPARISARSERRYAGDQLGWRNSGFSREARSVRIVTFEACSGFTRVTARRIAQPPKVTFVTRLRSHQLPSETARQLPDLSTIIRVEPSSTDDSRLQGALPPPDIMTD